MTLFSTYAQRRARLAQHIGPDAVAIIPTAPLHYRNRDNEYAYRPDSYFLYLTGFKEPHAWLIIEGNGRCTLICQPKDHDREIWDGYRLGPEKAPEALGVDRAFSCEELDAQVLACLSDAQTLWWPFGIHPHFCERITQWQAHIRRQSRQGSPTLRAHHDLCTYLDEARLFKDAHELIFMRKAASISASAHLRAMQRSAKALKAGQALFEYQLDAELWHEFRQQGASGPAYGNIVASGAHACVLHYRDLESPVVSGDLVLIDAGCEFEGYAADITRTFPANGRFSPHQRAVYEVVLAAQQAAIAHTHAGVSFDQPHDAALNVLAQGLLDLKLLSRDIHGNVDDVIAHRHYSRFYMHRTSHWLGLDVHDVGSYHEPTGSGAQKRVLQEGMVLTLEPGLYIRPAADVPSEFWNIGIRIEDDAIVQAHTCELITREVPVSVDEIEAYMASCL